MSKPYLFSKSQVTLNALKNPVRFSTAVRIVTPQPDGKLLVGGDFLDWGNIASRNFLIRLNSDGTLDTTFTANASDGGKFSTSVTTIAIQSDGKILVGGNFTNYAGTAGRNNLIRLNSDGTLDTAFCVNAADGNKFLSFVNTIAIQPDGKILVGGAFTNYNFILGRSRLIRLNSDGTLDTTFTDNASNNAGANKFSSSVDTIAIQSDGKILVGGDFANYAGTTGRNMLIRLNSTGTLDTTFTTNASDGTKFSSAVDAIAVQSDGKILVGGSFANYAGTTGRNRLIRLNSTGTLDTAFCVNASDGGKFSSTVNTIAIQPDGKILVGGIFTNYAGTTGRNRLIRLNSDGTVDGTFCASASDGSKFTNVIVSVSIQSDGKILVGGFFTNYAGTTGRNNLIRLNSDGTVDNVFCVNASDGPQINNYVSVIEVSSDGKILVGGLFTDYANVVGRNGLIRLNSDGTVDNAFCVNASDGGKFVGVINTITIQPDGKILVGGSFGAYAGVVGRNGLIRLNSDGTLDTAFCVNASDGGKFSSTINAVAVQSDNTILVGGLFTNYAGTANRNRLIRLNSNGTLDTTFCVNAVDGDKFNGAINAITIQSDDKILVGGDFANYAGTAGRSKLVRLNSNGTSDTAFCVNASDGGKFNGFIRSSTIQSDGKIVVGGGFTNYAGTVGRNNLIRLNSDGMVDNAFCVNAADGSKFSLQVASVSVMSNNKIIVCGEFYLTYNPAIKKLIQLNNDGTLDSWANNYFTNGVGSPFYVKATPYETFFANNSQFRFAYFDRNFDVI